MIITTIKNTKGGISLQEVESKLKILIPFLEKNQFSWSEGIELIDDLIHLRAHNNAVLSEEISQIIFDWIKVVYDSCLFDGFDGSHSDDEVEKIEIVKTLRTTINIVEYLNQAIEVLSFLEEKCQKTKNDFEKDQLDHAIKILYYQKENPSIPIEDKLLDTILERANDYFIQQLAEEEFESLFCGLKDTIIEHRLCYSMAYCLEIEKYISPLKRTRFVGGGRLFLSKKTDLMAIAGSGLRDWVEWFELEIENLEFFYILELEFSRKKIMALKILLQKNTPELMKLVQNNKIRIEGEWWLLEQKKHDFDNAGIQCEIIRDKRLRRRSNEKNE